MLRAWTAAWQELELIWMPPPAIGSGKLGTPCERMQSAYAIPRAPLKPPPLCEGLEDPQAAIAIADAIAPSMIKGLWRLLGGLPVRASGMSLSFGLLAASFVGDAR